MILPKPTTLLTLDTNLLIHALILNDHAPSLPAKLPQPSVVRSILKTTIANTNPVWLLHGAQIAELKQVIGRVVERGGTKTHKFSQEEMQNAVEMQRYILTLEGLLRGGVGAKNTKYITTDSDQGQTLVALGGVLKQRMQEFIAADHKETNPLTDTIIYLTALGQKRDNPTLGHLVFTMDGDFNKIADCTYTSFEELRQKNSKLPGQWTDVDKLFAKAVCHIKDKRASVPELSPLIPHIIRAMHRELPAAGTQPAKLLNQLTQIELGVIVVLILQLS